MHKVEILRLLALAGLNYFYCFLTRRPAVDMRIVVASVLSPCNTFIEMAKWETVGSLMYA